MAANQKVVGATLASLASEKTGTYPPSELGRIATPFFPTSAGSLFLIEKGNPSRALGRKAPLLLLRQRQAIHRAFQAKKEGSRALGKQPF